MAKIRFALRGTATVLMGKNTMMRKIISIYIKDHPGHPFEQVRRVRRGRVSWATFLHTNEVKKATSSNVKCSLSYHPAVKGGLEVVVVAAEKVLPEVQIYLVASNNFLHEINRSEHVFESILEKQSFVLMK